MIYITCLVLNIWWRHHGWGSLFFFKEKSVLVWSNIAICCEMSTYSKQGKPNETLVTEGLKVPLQVDSVDGRDPPKPRTGSFTRDLCPTTAKRSLSVCTKRWWEKQVHNYKLVRQGSLEQIMQGGSFKEQEIKQMRSCNIATCRYHL
jgi:hypothetical protein